MKSGERILEQWLIVRFQNGDRSAFEQLVERYNARLRYYVRRLLEDCRGEDDLLQEIWLSVFGHLRKLRDPQAFSTWLYRIARNKVYRQLRREKRIQSLTEGIEESIESQEPSDFRAGEAERVHKSLEKLRPKHREVLVLQFVEQMSYQDMATVIGCSVGTVRSRIHYAKRALRRALEEMSDDG